MLKSFFDPNGAFARGMERVWSLIVLNVLWLVCSLPVVTMGASCAALYQVLGKLIAGEDGHVARQFFRAWGENWKKATPVWLILLAGGGPGGLDPFSFKHLRRPTDAAVVRSRVAGTVKTKD